MSEYIGTIGERKKLIVTLMNCYSYYTNFGDNYIYTMCDTDGNVLVWKTTKILSVNPGADVIKKGDLLEITGTIKEHLVYKDVKQTHLTRCKFSFIEHKTTKSELKKESQLKSLQDGDFIERMLYSRYKKHYSDCEVLEGSYNKSDKFTHPTIEVIIRKGRLKNNGVRGQQFKSYVFVSPDNIQASYRAVSEENARKQLLKDYPNAENFELVTIY
jgi:hypothetical protein